MNVVPTLLKGSPPRGPALLGGPRDAELHGQGVDVEALIARRTLDGEPWPAYVVGRDGRVLCVNAAWDRVAAISGGPSGAEVLGTRWLDHIHGSELVTWFREVLRRVLGERRGEGHVGDCNTAVRHRLFFTRFEPLTPPGASEAEAMLAATTLMSEGPIEQAYAIGPPDEQRYRQATNLILQCGGCRRVLVTGSNPRVWEFVPEFVARPRADLSHGLCGLCREVHYGQRLRVTR